jgi:hypothetical protein
MGAEKGFGKGLIEIILWFAAWPMCSKGFTLAMSHNRLFIR